jgi:hypothetical protein
MLAELAAFNAAYQTVKATVQAGRELSSAASQIGTMVQSKEKLQRDLQKKKNSPFSRQVETDLEEFLALEDIAEAERQLEQLMIYGGRAGLRDDWLKYQVEARKRRKEAEKQAAKEREEMIEAITTAFAVVAAFAIVVASLYYLGVYMGKW